MLGTLLAMEGQGYPMYWPSNFGVSRTREVCIRAGVVAAACMLRCQAWKDTGVTVCPPMLNQTYITLTTSLRNTHTTTITKQ